MEEKWQSRSEGKQAVPHEDYYTYLLLYLLTTLLTYYFTYLLTALTTFSLRLPGIGSLSEDMHGACKTRWRTSSAVAQVRFCKTFLVSGIFNPRGCEWEGKEEQMTKILLIKNKFNVFAKATIEEWSGRCILGQRCKILLNTFRSDPWSPECWANNFGIVSPFYLSHLSNAEVCLLS